MGDLTGEDPRIGTVLGERYLIRDRLGEGGMGIVYRAERIGLGRSVAVKFLHEMYSMDRQFYGRFEREARAMSSLTHPNCVSVIDYGFDVSPYIVMDFAEGKTLRDVLDDGPIGPSRGVALGRQLLAALAHAHGQGIIHRDVKPSNIMVSHATGMGDHLMIFDFGLAKLVYNTRIGDLSTAAQILGTPSYMSPEQTKAADVDFRSDLYSAGVVIFEMLTGLKPFRHTNPMEVVRMQRLAPAPRLKDLAPNLPFSPELEALVARALEKAPADRFQSAAEFLGSINAVPESSGSASGRVLRAETPSSPQAHYTLNLNETTEEMRADHIAAHVQQAAARRQLEVHPAGNSPGLTARGKRSPDEKSSPQPFLPTDEGFHMPSWVYIVVAIAIVGAGVAIAASLLGTDTDAAEQGNELRVSAPTSTDAALEGHKPAALHDEELLTPSTDSVAALRALPPPPAKVYDLADVRTLMQHKKYQEAAEGLNQLRKIDPSNAYYPFLQGTLYFQLDDFASGIDHYKQALDLDPAYAKRKALNVDLIRALGNEKTFKPARSLITSPVGKEAVMYLNRAANEDPDPLVRKRALALAKQLDK